jgi:hypothetical protein
MAALEQDVRAALAALSTLQSLSRDIDIFNRLLYKNRNQHRRGVYFRRTLAVRRLLSLVEPQLNSLQSALTDLNLTALTSESALRTLQLVLSTGQSVYDACVACLLAARHYLHMFASGFFLPLSLAMISALARLVALFRAYLSTLAPLVNESAGLFTALKGISQQTLSQSIRTASWLIEPRFFFHFFFFQNVHLK